MCLEHKLSDTPPEVGIPSNQSEVNTHDWGASPESLRHRYISGVLLWLFLLVLVPILRGPLLGFAGFTGPSQFWGIHHRLFLLYFHFFFLFLFLKGMSLFMGFLAVAKEYIHANWLARRPYREWKHLPTLHILHHVSVTNSEHHSCITSCTIFLFFAFHTNNYRKVYGTKFSEKSAFKLFSWSGKKLFR